MVALSRTQFRGLVTATIVLYLVTLGVVELHLVSYSHEMEVAYSWNHYGAMLPYSVRLCWSLTLTLLNLASLVGLLFFRNVARWVIAAFLLMQIVVDPFTGLLVLRPIDHMLESLAGLMMWLVVVVSIFSPLAAEFGARPPKSAPTAR